jgi:hypothetical protein
MTKPKKPAPRQRSTPTLSTRIYQRAIKIDANVTRSMELANQYRLDHGYCMDEAHSEVRSALKMLSAQVDSLREAFESLKTVVAHVERLMREKEMLREQVENAEAVSHANRYMATPLPPVLTMPVIGPFEYRPVGTVGVEAVEHRSVATEYTITEDEFIDINGRLVRRLP